MRPLRFYDFFAGVGMVELALSPEWECVWANDIDPKKAAIYRANHDFDRFHFGDIANVSGRDLPASADLAWASFPCQDLSLAGWRRGMTAPRSGTFWEFYRVMSELHHDRRRPPIIVLENVLGLLGGSDFSALCEALSSLDMQFGALVIDAIRFLPQSRPRVFVVAVDDRINVQDWSSDDPEVAWTSQSLVEARRRLAPASARRWRWWKLPVPANPVRPVASLLEANPAGVRWNDAEETDRLLSMMSPRNLDKVEKARSEGEPSVGFLYKRTRKGQQRAEVRFDGIAGCLRTPTGGSSRQTLVIVEDGHVRTRLISPREAARLMGVDDGFKLDASNNDAYHAMGDGVAAPAVRWLGRHLLTPLANRVKSQSMQIQAPHQSQGMVTTRLAPVEELATSWR